MRNLKQELSSRNGFIDNEFLDKYCQLIERNTVTRKMPRVTNSHHIIPKSWFKLNAQPVDDSLSNLVNLVYRDHVLAHYFLCLCTTDKLQYCNELALMCLTTRKKLNAVDKQLVTRLPLYYIIYENYKKHKDSNYQLYVKEENIEV